MKTNGRSAEREGRRQLAMARRQEGYTQQEIADFLGVDVRTVQRWDAAWKKHGLDGLKSKPISGRPPKLTSEQERTVLSWLETSPLDHDFVGELWTANRIGQLIEMHFGVRFHTRYLNHWLTQRGITPQKPKRKAYERDEEAINDWCHYHWTRIVKKGLAKMPTSY
jgi:transposase